MDEKAPRGPVDRFAELFLTGFRRIGLSIAVVFTLISSAFLFMVGVYNGVISMKNFLNKWVVKDALSGLIKTMDIFLAALVMMLLALGLYDLFIADTTQRNEESAGRMPGFSSTLDELKNSMAKLIIIILIITFLELVLADLDNLSEYELLIVPVGAFLVAVSLRLVMPERSKKTD